jgi:hypothetical protein
MPDPVAIVAASVIALRIRKCIENPRGLAVPRDHNLPSRGLFEVARKIVLHLGQRYFFHGFPNCASHDVVSDFGTTARTSTTPSTTS